MRIYLLFLLFGLFVSAAAQDVLLEKAVPSGRYLNIEWGSADSEILPNEPAGKFSGVQASNGTIYLAVNDTLATQNLGLVVFVSSDNGATWALSPSGISNRGLYENVKMIRTSLDSIYCFFQWEYNVYCWNVLSPAPNLTPVLTGGYRSFDVVTSSTGGLYLFIDILATNQIYRYSSLNGGHTWGGSGLITSNGANPKVSMSGTGDTLLLNYYGPVLTDTATSVIRLARYRETTPGTLASAGFSDITTDAAPKYEYVAATNNSEMWFFFTSGAVGLRDIKARRSGDGGVSWGSVFTVAGSETLDEFGMDIRYHSYGGYGFDLVYTADSAQAGQPSAATDKVLFSNIAYGAVNFTEFTQINEEPAATYSPRYANTLVPLPFTSDVGVAYVGGVDGSKKLYWDRWQAVIPVELSSFTAAGNGNSTILNWQTATETNNKGFFIERKDNNGEFSSISFIEGKGTTTEKQSYYFSDNNLNAGIYTYRLRQVDYDGAATISNSVEVVITNPDNFGLGQNYPNPFNPSTEIYYQLPVESKVSLKVFNLLGGEVTTLVNETKPAGSYSVNFNASNLPSGVYMYEMRAGGVSLIKKMTLVK